MTTINKILVPTDFSENARTAFEYALDLAERFNASIEVVHVYTPIDDSILVYANQPYILNLRKELQDFVTQTTEKESGNGTIDLRKTKVKSDLLYGNITNTLIDLSKTDYDLVIMGSMGGGSFAEMVFGSVTTKVAQDAYCPVLVIPKGSTYRRVKHLAYACDFGHKSFKHPTLVADVADLFNAKIDLLYVQPIGEKQDTDKTHIDDMLAVFETEAPQLSVTAHIIEEDDVFEGINQFAQTYQTDMVVVITKHHSTLQKLLHPSVTKEMAMYTNLPLLVLKSD